MNSGDVILLAGYAALWMVVWAGGNWLERRERKRAAQLRIARQVSAECDRVLAMILAKRAARQRPAPGACNLRLDVLRVAGDSDADVVDALLGEHQPRRSEW